MVVPSPAAPAANAVLSGLAQLVAAATPTDGRPLPEGDLSYRQQRVADYASDPSAMWRYTHMYGAKHPAAWMWIRALCPWAADASRPLVSLGAGPLLCLAGWNLVQKPHLDMRAVDVLDWSPVVDSPAGRVLQHALGHPKRITGVFAPQGAQRRPAQLRGISGIRSLQHSDIPDGATLILPMMLNHLLEGPRLPTDTQAALRDMFADFKSRGCRFVIADILDQNWTNLWSHLSALLDSPPPTVVGFPQALSCLAPLFDDPEHAAYRAQSPMARLRVLAWDGEGWHRVGTAA